MAQVKNSREMVATIEGVKEVTREITTTPTSTSRASSRASDNNKTEIKVKTIPERTTTGTIKAHTVKEITEGMATTTTEGMATETTEGMATAITVVMVMATMVETGTMADDI